MKIGDKVKIKRLNSSNGISKFSVGDVLTVDILNEEPYKYFCIDSVDYGEWFSESEIEPC
ncbi:hypothetical protein [Providencia sp. PROV260]|uniref:hypothetical protein n=1 Tax=Providencia sp. PROV260 TaxID=2949948 RepID=UPI00234A3637|nr:hypothetical protein [Providencia sp. PROV260]